MADSQACHWCGARVHGNDVDWIAPRHEHDPRCGMNCLEVTDYAAQRQPYCRRCAEREYEERRWWARCWSR